MKKTFMKYDFNLKHKLFLKSEAFIKNYVLSYKGIIEDLYVPNILFLLDDVQIVKKCLEWENIDLMCENASNENILMYKKSNISLELLDFYLSKGIRFGNKDPYLIFREPDFLELLFKYKIALKSDSFYLTGQNVNISLINSLYNHYKNDFFAILENEIKRAINKKTYTSLKYKSTSQKEILQFFISKNIPNNILLMLFKSHIMDISMLDDLIDIQGIYAINILNKQDVLGKPLLFSYIDKHKNRESLKKIINPDTQMFYESINWKIIGYNQYENVTMFMHESLFKPFIFYAPDYLIASYHNKFLLNIDTYEELETFVNKTNLMTLFDSKVIEGEECIITTLPLPLYCLAIEKNLISQRKLPSEKRYNLSQIFHKSLNMRINNEEYFEPEYQSKKAKESIIFLFNLVLSEAEKNSMQFLITDSKEPVKKKRL